MAESPWTAYPRWAHFSAAVPLVAMAATVDTIAG